MADCLDICKICLHTDVSLKEIDKSLAEYFAVLTDFRLSHIDTRLCSHCEYLLRKTQKFTRICEKSSVILEKWIQESVFEKTTGKAKKQLNSLCEEIPQISLQIHHQDVSKTHNYCYQEERETNGQMDNELVSENNCQNIIKQEIDSNTQEFNLKDLIDIKIEDATNSFQQVLIQNDILNRTENVTGTLNENDVSVNDVEDDTYLSDNTSYDISEIKDDLSSDDECLAAKISRKISTNNVFDKNDTTNKSESKISKKLKIMQKELSTIYKDWQRICLSELPQIPFTKYDISKVSKIKKVSEDKKGGVVTKLTNISTDLDNIKEDCEKLISYKEGLLNPKESLKSELTKKFSSCGELKTEDGFIINKETVLNCFERVSECLMKRLWRFVHGKSTFDQRAINTLKHIQNKYQNEYQYETVFHIQYLNTKEKVAEEFEKRRTYECYLNAKYKCDMCYLGFKYEAQMENHKLLHEETAGDFACPICGVRHKSKKSLDTHSKSHEAVYKCKLCPLVTYYRYSMMNHYNQHEGLEYRCEECNTTFKSKSAYKTHVGLRHTEGSHTCATCGRSLATQRALHWHIARAHKRGPQNASTNGLLPVSCSDCGLKFASAHACVRHARAKHASTPAHSNSGCDNTTQKGTKEGTPKKKPTHTCRVCNAIGHSVGWLSLHFRSSHPEVDMALTYADKQPHLCELCGKGYTNIYNLRDHLSIHAGVRAHACRECGARFHRAASLQQHIATHAPPSRVCRVCGKRFRSHSNLNNHMRGHIGDRRYKCNLCGKGFLHRNALNEHIRGVHYKLRRARRKTNDISRNNIDISRQNTDISRNNIDISRMDINISRNDIDISRQNTDISRNNMTVDTTNMSNDTSRSHMSIDTTN